MPSVKEKWYLNLNSLKHKVAFMISKKNELQGREVGEGGGGALLPAVQSLKRTNSFQFGSNKIEETVSHLFFYFKFYQWMNTRREKPNKLIQKCFTLFQNNFNWFKKGL